LDCRSYSGTAGLSTRAVEQLKNPEVRAAVDEELNLSDNNLKQAQTNTVLVQQEEMDRVGFEPTISAHQLILSPI
jgi:hypothetical protein